MKNLIASNRSELLRPEPKHGDRVPFGSDKLHLEKGTVRVAVHNRVALHESVFRHVARKYHRIEFADHPELTWDMP